MMPELGKYAFAVLSSYGASLLLLAALVGFVVLRNAKAKRALKSVERSNNNG